MSSITIIIKHDFEWVIIKHILNNKITYKLSNSQFQLQSNTIFNNQTWDDQEYKTIKNKWRVQSTGGSKYNEENNDIQICNSIFDKLPKCGLIFQDDE